VLGRRSHRGQDEKCLWLRPERVAQVEFLEWTSGDRLRHARFVRLREDKEPREVVKEHAGESASTRVE